MLSQHGHWDASEGISFLLYQKGHHPTGDDEQAVVNNAADFCDLPIFLITGQFHADRLQ